MNGLILVTLLLWDGDPQAQSDPPRLADRLNRAASLPDSLIPPKTPPGHIPLNPNRPPTPTQNRPTSEVLALLGEPAWVLRPRRDPPVLAMECPWRHPAVTILAERARADEATARAVLEAAGRMAGSGGKQERFPAALLLAELGNASHLDVLAAKLVDASATAAERSSAAYALARFPTRLDPRRLERLMETWIGPPNQVDTLPTSGQITGDSAELVASVAWALVACRLAEPRYDPVSDPWIIRIGDWPFPPLRRAAAIAHSGRSWDAIPRVLNRLLDDVEPSVRGSALAALTKHPASAGRPVVLRMTSDVDVHVAQMAVQLLAVYPDLETTRRLTDLQSHSSPLIRQSVVKAAGKLGQESLILHAVEDPSADVRAEAAIALAGLATVNASKTLLALLADDRSSSVQRAVVDGAAKQPLDRAAPILLAALESSTAKTREHAARELSRFLPAAKDFPAHESAEVRAERIESLRREWAKTFASVRSTKSNQPRRAQTRSSPTTSELVRAWLDGGHAIRTRVAETLKSLPPDALPQVEDVFLKADVIPAADFVQQVLAAMDPAYAAVDRISAGDSQTIEAAASTLSAEFAKRPTSTLQAILLARAALQTDARCVWTKVVPLVLRDHAKIAAGEDARGNVVALAVDRLFERGFDHADESVRRSMCEWIEASPNTRHADRLASLMNDPSERVRRAAIRAAGATADPDLTESLYSALRSPSTSVQLEAASQLCRQGNREGLDAMRRLFASPDAEVRRRVLDQVANCPDNTVRDDVLRLLTLGLTDGKLEVREQAVAGLERVVGYSHAGPTNHRTPHDQQVARWKKTMATLFAKPEETARTMDQLKEIQHAQEATRARQLAN